MNGLTIVLSLLPPNTILISTPDTHTHPPQTPNIGLMPPSLLEWLDRYTYPLETRLSLPSSIPLATRILAKHIHKSLSCGTTTSCYFSTISVGTTNVLSTLCYTLGQRALVGRVNMDRPATTPDDYRDASVASAVSDTRATIEHCRRIDPAATLVEAIITPRFAPSCTKELLGALGNLAGEEGVRVQTHLSECKGEIMLVRELFPEAENYTGVYDEAGLLDKGTVLAHCVHLSTEEMHILSLRGAGVAHCPTSNLALGSGLCKVRRLLNARVKVGLGSDISGGWCVGMLEVARVGLGVSATVEGMSDDENLDRRLAVGEILYLATKGGAAVLGLEAKGVGGFEVGGVWDAQLVELGIPVGEIPPGSDHANEREGPSGPVELWGVENWEEKLGKWVWGGDERNTVAVWVEGREVYRSGPHACNRSRVA